MSEADIQYGLVVKQNRELQQELMPFRDSYFRNLTTVEIAGLAKKSIRITTENCNMVHDFEKISQLLDCCCIVEAADVEKLKEDIKEICKKYSGDTQWE